MSLTLLTGPVRSGKSELGQRLAAATGLPVMVAVAGTANDAEMVLRIERHRRARPEGWTTLELTPEALDAPDGPAAWLTTVPDGHALLVDCLGTLLAAAAASHDLTGEIVSPEGQLRFETACREITTALVARGGETIVVSNEVGWGVVPAYPSARLFRDALARANRDLTASADRALLVVAGRVIDLKFFPSIEETT
jgi:adenosylcobinamide kinase/adenosylcobinamide-phosphate guanylyltransferase